MMPAVKIPMLAVIADRLSTLILTAVTASAISLSVVIAFADIRGAVIVPLVILTAPIDPVTT